MLTVSNCKFSNYRPYRGKGAHLTL